MTMSTQTAKEHTRRPDMPDTPNPSIDRKVQALDVHIVDVLAHLEALLRHSHSIQRGLLTLRAEAPPPAPASTEHGVAAMRAHAREMRHDCQILSGIVEDLAAGIDAIVVDK